MKALGRWAFFCALIFPLVVFSYTERIKNPAAETFTLEDDFPDWNFLTEYYIPSPLGPLELKEIIGVESEAKNLSQLNQHSDAVKRILFRILQYTLQVPFDATAQTRWGSLAEMRYSYLRDLFTALSLTPNTYWQATDFRLRDGSYVFAGKIKELLIVRAYDGALIKIHQSKAFEKESWILRDNLPILSLPQFSCADTLSDAS